MCILNKLAPHAHFNICNFNECRDNLMYKIVNGNSSYGIDIWGLFNKWRFTGTDIIRSNSTDHCPQSAFNYFNGLELIVLNLNPPLCRRGGSLVVSHAEL